MDPKQLGQEPINNQPNNEGFVPAQQPEPQVFAPTNNPGTPQTVQPSVDQAWTPQPVAPVAPEQSFNNQTQPNTQEAVIGATPAPVAASTQQPWQPNSTPPGPVMSYNELQGSGKTPRKKLLFITGGALAAILLVSGVVFGYYIPNKPANVYSTGLERSGKAIDKLTASLTDQKNIDSFKKSEIIAKGEAKFGKETYNGTFSTKFDETKLNLNLEAGFPGADGAKQTVSANLVSQVEAGSQIPNSFLKLTGFSAFGVDSFAPGFSQYDGKWISITKDYLVSLGIKEEDFKTSDGQLLADFSNADVSQLIKSVSDPSKEYLFTADKDKAVFENKAYLGKEDSEGIKAHRYTVGINKAHAKDYCKALITSVTSTDAYKKLDKNDETQRNKDRDDAIKSCQESIDNDIKDTDTFEMWIDSKYKIIHKIRAYDDTDVKSYFEIGQIYKGKDDITFFSNFHEDKEKYDVKFKIDSNLKTVSSKGELLINGGEGDDTYDVKVTLEAKPLTGDVKIDAPKDAVPIKTLFDQLGINPAELANFYGGTQSQAGDAEVKADINAVQAQLEAYYAQNGTYPNRADFDSASWRSQNLVGLDEEALKNSNGSRYRYVSDCSGLKDCQSYKLEGRLDDGSLYTKTSLN